MRQNRNPFLRLVRRVRVFLIRSLGRYEIPPLLIAAIVDAEGRPAIPFRLCGVAFGLLGIAITLFQSGWRFPQAFCVSPKTSPPLKAIVPTPNPAPLEFQPTPQTQTNQP